MCLTRHHDTYDALLGASDAWCGAVEYAHRLSQRRFDRPDYDLRELKNEEEKDGR